MTDALPLQIIIAYSFYAFFAAEQKFAIQEVRVRRQAYYSILMLFMAVTSLFGIGYLVYYAFIVSWWAAIALFLIGLLAFLILGFIGVYIPAWILALSSFVTIPLLAVYLMQSIPKLR
jgi:hypothetical protein